jgi:hypothetical protein
MDPYVLEFFEVSSGRPIGRVQWDGVTWQVDPALGSLVDADLGPQGFLERYDGWTNGYVIVRRPGQQRPRPQGGMTLPSTEETDAAVTSLVDTNSYLDESGEPYQPLDPPVVPGANADDDGEA